MHVSIQAEPTLDPRGEFRRKPAALAQRLSDLNCRTILLFDNTQLKSQMANYGPMFRWISESLQNEGATCIYRSQNLLRGGNDELLALADDIVRSEVDAVVIALCNAGITQPSSLFAAELEARGKPCVQICTDMGYQLAGVTAASYAPGLPIVLVQPASGADENFGKAEAVAIVPEIKLGLVGDSETLLSRFSEQFSAHEFKISRNGDFELAAVAASAVGPQEAPIVRIDPGKFAVELYEELCAGELCDGFPVVPPTRERVEAMLRYTDLDPDHALVNELPPSGATITVHALAVNAVLAGCRPEYLPILIAAFQALADPAYRLFQGAITSHSSANAVIVSGLLAAEVGINSGPGCLGPGFRANATIGRAINLTIMNVSRAFPGKADLGVYGSPAEYSYCFAESLKDRPWQPIHADLYGDEFTSVTVHKIEGPHNVLDPRNGAEGLLRTIAAMAASPGGNNMVHPAAVVVIINPGQARMIAKAGWSKRDVKEFLFETARHPAELIRQQERASFPPHLLGLDQVPVMRSPDDVILVVCGGQGTHAMVGVPWGLAQSASRPVTFKDGSPIRSIANPLR